MISINDTGFDVMNIYFNQSMKSNRDRLSII